MSPPRPHLSRDERGFTLLEVLLAVAILTTMVVMVLSAVSSSFRMQSSATRMVDTQRAATQTIRRMVQELNMAFIVAEVSEDLAQNGEIRYRTIFEGDRDEITFCTMGYLQRFTDQAGGGQAEISYRVESVRDRHGDLREALVRREQAPIDEDPDRGGTLTPVLWDVEDISFEYWDPDREIGDNAWVDTWDARDNEERLPDRVRITLEIAHPILPRETMTFSQEADIRIENAILLLPADVADALQEQQQQQEDALRDQGINPNQIDQRDNLREAIREATP